jgi:glutamate dehydrogenase
MPFLVDSTVGYLYQKGIKVKNVIHPVYSVKRGSNGDVQEILNDRNGNAESVIQLHIDKTTSESEIKSIQENIAKIIKTVGLVVGDWQSMINAVRKSSKEIENSKIILNDEREVAEIKNFISWIEEGNFILLGTKEFDVKKERDNEYQLEEVKNSGLGVFRSEYEELRPIVVNSSFAEVTDSVVNPYVIEILKSRYRSCVHRISNAERIRIQKISQDGKVIGEFRFIGLFTSSAYNQSPNLIPLIRNKIAKVVADSGYAKGSHNYKDLLSTLEYYPRDELFQTSPQDLLRISTGIVSICGRSQVRFFARKDKFSRFVSCLIFTPRDHTNSELRDKLKVYLAKVYKGYVADSFLQTTESNITRFHLIIKTDQVIPEINESKVEEEIYKIVRPWNENLIEEIKKVFGNQDSRYYCEKYHNAFSVSYSNRFNVNEAIVDIAKIEQSLKNDSVLFDLYKSNDDEQIVKLKIYSSQKELILSDIMPILENFGFNVIQEHTYIVEVKNEQKNKIWINYFRLSLKKLNAVFSNQIKNNFEEIISLTWLNINKSSPLDRLVISANLDWKEVYMLQAYVKYLYQIGFKYSQIYIAEVLSKYSEFTVLLSSLFSIKFDPNLSISFDERKNKIKEVTSKTLSFLDKVSDVNHDFILRKILNLIESTLRTNYYQTSNDGKFKGYLSFKFECSKVLDLPLPMPYAEIFVYSANVEAVHLRGGKVARGGLRWSDRHEDFRTEVLGLMKAQMTKNAVIVPVGSKGGFVVKKDISGLTRDEIQKEGIECYKTFLRGALDITDNVLSGKVEHPKNAIIYDVADPYFVVAADKGTATFSDIANQISAEYGFWLGDAFASGGSVGYDHKKMGITAKGAWISVKRHFQEMGIDTQSQNFTCVGIGDLMGDVFGNGMMLSQHIKLVAAFNHMHIFLDPNPDEYKSFKERVRMFNLPRSTWIDYDKSLISKGGGIFERSAKTITISDEVKKILDIDKDELNPNDLIKAILKAPVDLLWNGGIGTYVKASDESNQDVGDRSNDLLRVNGSELRCKVVGEGGNLGFTQKGRIEYAMNGGRINTDAMDNSAGVDCSDHEVNIKIALTQALRAKKITIEERNKILEEMTQEVSELVLSDNNFQTQAISITRSLGNNALDEQSNFLDALEKVGLLNRTIEFLPSRKEIEKRQIDNIDITRPELCVMLAYSKMSIYNNILSSDLLKDKYFENELFSYFPKKMQQQFADQISNHQLRNEIIATQITNFIVNRTGITFVNQVCQDSGFSVVDVVRSLIIVCDSFRLRDIWAEIENLTGKIDSQVQLRMLLSASKLLERSTLWLLRNKSEENISSAVNRFRKIADELFSLFPLVLAEDSKKYFEDKIDKYLKNKISKDLAVKIASFDPIASAFDIAEISTKSNLDIKTIAKIYFAVGTRFSLKYLRNKLSSLEFTNHWHKLSSKTILEDIYGYQMQIAKKIVDFSCNKKGDCESDSVENWAITSKALVERYDNFISNLKTESNIDLSFFVVALNRLKPLVD